MEHCTGLIAESFLLWSLGSRHVGSVAAVPQLQHTRGLGSCGVLGVVAL